MALFDDIDRSDPSPRAETESSFTFLNRVDGAYWEKVRELLEAWFMRYPPEGKAALRESFRSEREGQHWGAWWELYLYELFARCGYEIKIHPELPDSPKAPDFELNREGSRLYVEATVVFSGIQSSEEDHAPSWMLDAVNDVNNPNFSVWLQGVERVGDTQLKRREIAEPLQGWLDQLDPDEVSREYKREGVFPRYTLRCRGWEILFEAWPVKAEARGRSDRRMLAAGPMQAGFTDDVGQLLRKLKSKAGRYGRPDVPLVTAVLCISPTMDLLDIEQALFGQEAFKVPLASKTQARLIRQRNGFWMEGQGPINRRVSAVLTAVGLHPGNVARVAPRIWLNPWANFSFAEDCELPRSVATEGGGVVHHEGDLAMSTVFDLSPSWPDEKRFPRPAN